jgi:hypothetical protein
MKLTKKEALEYIKKRYFKQTILWEDYLIPRKLMVVPNHG